MKYRVVVLHKQHPSYFQEELLRRLINTVSFYNKFINTMQAGAALTLGIEIMLCSPNGACLCWAIGGCIIIILLIYFIWNDT
jgi:hypothetical protein